jgi:four helix bundle protein
MASGYKGNIAWQKNQQAIVKTLALVESFPKTVPFRNISSQLFSSITSVGANIAEGYSDFEGAEYPRYLKIAIRSAYETDHWLTTLLSIAEVKKEIDVVLVKELLGSNLEVIKILTKIRQTIEIKRKIGK